jgi:hypothetical protein
METNLTPAQQELLNKLDAINGTDAYDTTSEAIGVVTEREHLWLPEGFELPQFVPDRVGSAAAATGFTIEQKAAIYHLNASHAPEGVDPNVWGLLRLELVMAGWCDLQNQTEISRGEPSANAIPAFFDALATHVDNLKFFRKIAYVLPMVAEVVFRTTGHHYLSSLAADYNKKYAQVFNACLIPLPTTYLPAESAYHALSHWVMPGTSYAAAISQATTERLPEALKVRLTAAPAGTAVITTSAAAYDSLLAGLDTSAVPENVLEDLNLIRSTARSIKADPVPYHLTQRAYRRNDRPRDISAVKELASRYAWLAQGYITSVLRDSALGRAVALKKHAEQNQLSFKRAQRFFTAASREDVSDFPHLFKLET